MGLVCVLAVWISERTNFNVIKGSSELWFNVMHERKLEVLALVGSVLNYDCNNSKLKRASELKCVRVINDKVISI